MRRKTLAGGAGRKRWFLAVVLAAVLVSAVGAGADPAATEGVGKGNPAKETAGKENPGKEAVKVEHGELVVQVRDAAGKPVRGAAVSVVIGDEEIEQRSDGNGQAKFRDLPLGPLRVQAVATGWNSSGRNVALDEDRVQVDLTLTPRKPPAGGTVTGGGVPGPDTPQAATGSAGTGAAPQDGVEGAGSSNPLAPTKQQNQSIAE
jgi:hypothetical protein